LLQDLGAAGLASELVMIDGRLVLPNTPIPEGWREVRLRSPAGTLTLARRSAGVSVVVFGNADAALQAAQEKAAALIEAQTTP
jgi:hypothetical protein